MQPTTPAPAAGTPGISSEDLSKLITGLKDDLVKEMDSRFSSYDEKLTKVDHLDSVITEAQRNQAEALRKQREEAAAKAREGWQPQTWEDVMQRAKDEALAEFNAKQEQERQQSETKSRRQQQQEEEWDRQIDHELTNLEKVGYLPSVNNPRDYNDPGVAARRELLVYAADLGTPDLSQAANTLSALHRANQRYDAEKHEITTATDYMGPLPGKYAPVGNSSTTSPTSTFTGPTSRELRNMSMDQLVSLAQQRGYGPVPESARTQAPF